mmetsp:Transcript_7674/g.15216  ORF Transcript_7674/g.15216 Transcript_7674/m.15216 type:complete len:210 (-) Transcript_7674:1413-2042(-)
MTNLIKKKKLNSRKIANFNKCEIFKKLRTKNVPEKKFLLLGNRDIFPKKNFSQRKLDFYQHFSPEAFVEKKIHKKNENYQKYKPFNHESLLTAKKTFPDSKPSFFFKLNSIKDTRENAHVKLKPAFFKEANVTFEQFKRTLKLKIISIFSVDQTTSEASFQIRKGATLEVDVADFKLIFNNHFIPKRVLVKVRNNPSFDGCVNAIFFHI